MTELARTHLTRTGRCLCGAVAFSATLAEPHADACHCGMCRRWAGGPALTVKAAGEPDIAGADAITVYKSSDWGERRFCSRCGTHLFVAAPEFAYFGVSLGTLDDLSGLDLRMEIFTDFKPDLYDFANPTERLTEAQFLELVGAGPPAGGANG